MNISDERMQIVNTSRVYAENLDMFSSSSPEAAVRPPGNIFKYEWHWWSQNCRRLLIFCDLVLAGASRRMGQAGNIGNPDRDWEGCGQDTKSGCEKRELSMARQHHRVHKTSL